MALIAMMAAASMATTGFGPPILSDGQYPPLLLDPVQVAAIAKTKEYPAITARATVVLDVDSGQTLYSVGAHDPLPPASTVKIMTALIALQKAQPGDLVTVSATAAETDGSRMGLTAGETLTVEELLYGLLLPSGNDAAVALAEHVSGGADAFVQLMNETAASLGMGDTHFVNPHGLDDPSQSASAADLATVAQAALRMPLFSKIVATREVVVSGHQLQNTNELLGSVENADGVKTGTTDQAGECLVASFNRAGHRLLVVVLGSQDRYADAAALMQFAEESWRWTSLGLPDNALAWVLTPDNLPVRLRGDGWKELFLPVWQIRLLQPVRIVQVLASDPESSQVGVVRWQLGSGTVAEESLSVWRVP